MDLGYARRLFNQGTNITELYFPIVTFDANGNAHVDFYQFLPGKDAFKKIKVSIASELREELGNNLESSQISWLSHKI